MSKSSTTRKQANEQIAAHRRQRQIGILIGIGSLALIGAAALIFISIPKGTPAGVADFAGLEQETVPMGQALGFALGDPDAPVTLVEFADFSCPHCYKVSSAIGRLIDENVRSGSLRIVFVPVTFVNPPTSEPAAKAMICAAEQGKAWEMHDEIWSRYVTPGVSSFRESILTGVARNKLGLDGAEFTTCFNAEETNAQIELQLFEASSRDVKTTPSLFLNDVRVSYATDEDAYPVLAAQLKELLAPNGD
jgi:protein-disulfide isomerase